MNWLKVVGAGIRLGQVTFEVQRTLVEADVVLALVSNSLALEMLRHYNNNIIDLSESYALERERIETYREMADKILAEVRAHKNVCVAIYGHPSIFACPGTMAIDTARQEGFKVELQPGISAADSAFCDLEIDPAVHGCQIYCATAFVLEERVFDPHSILTLWQASIIGETRLMNEGDSSCHRKLCDRLEAIYGPSHPVILYEAATNCFFPPDMRKVPLSDLRTTKIRPCCTLIVPPINYPDLVRVPLSTAESVWFTFPSRVALDSGLA